MHRFTVYFAFNRRGVGAVGGACGGLAARMSDDAATKRKTSSSSPALALPARHARTGPAVRPLPDREWTQASGDDRGVFLQLLECEDDKLWRWFMGHEHCPDDALACTRPADPSAAALNGVLRAGWPARCRRWASRARSRCWPRRCRALAAWPLALSALAFGLWRARRESQIAGQRAVSSGQRPAGRCSMACRSTRSRCTGAVRWRSCAGADRDGRSRRLSWWPDTLPPRRRRELRLAAGSLAAAPAAARWHHSRYP